MSGLLAVHRLHDFDDVSETGVTLVPAACDQLDARRELLEVETFRRAQWMFPEERNGSAQGDPAVALLNSGRGALGGCHTAD
jgi:hypothetical protein